MESPSSHVRAKRTAPILDSIHCSHISGGTIIQECVQQYSEVSRYHYFYFMNNSYMGQLPIGRIENLQQCRELPLFSPTESSPTYCINYRTTLCKECKVSAIISKDDAQFSLFLRFPDIYLQIQQCIEQQDEKWPFVRFYKIRVIMPTRCMDHRKTVPKDVVNTRKFHSWNDRQFVCIRKFMLLTRSSGLG